MYSNFFKPIYFTVADTDPQNPPKTFEEFNQLCASIKREIPAQGDNISFAEKIFTFFKDCGLITRKNVAFLSDSFSCRRNFYCPMNPVGGVLRKAGLSMGNPAKYYCSKNRGRAVICESEVYYISNYWFDTFNNTNKAEFYNWVMNKAFINLGVPQDLRARKLMYNPYQI